MLWTVARPQVEVRGLRLLPQLILRFCHQPHPFGNYLYTFQLEATCNPHFSHIIIRVRRAPSRLTPYFLQYRNLCNRVTFRRTYMFASRPT